MSKSKTQTSRRQAGSKSSGQQQTQNTPRSRSRRKAIARSRSKNRRDKTNISATAFEILPVRPDLLNAVWPHIEPHLQRAVDQSEGLIDIHDVREASGTGEMLVWVVSATSSGTIQGAYTTRIIAYPQRSALAVDLVGGSQLSRWLQMALQSIEIHARRLGCEQLEGYGRAAWGRVLRDHNWRLAYHAFYKDLE